MTDSFQLIEKTKQVYELLYEACSGIHTNYVRYNSMEDKMIENFVQKLNYSVGDDWLWNYFCFQFSRYTDQKTRMKGRIMVSWVVGPAAFKKYKEAPDEQKYWGKEFQQRLEVKNPLLEPISLPEAKEYKERERNRFKEELRRLLHCKENELFDKKSKTCYLCKNKKECEL
jgi:hypothetical protein